MNRFVELLVAVMLTGAMPCLVLAAATDRCPSLPASSGLAWQISEGPDFSVCYASPSQKSSGATLGVYLGLHPSFHPNESLAVRSGTIEGTPITWYRKQVEDPAFKVGVETLHALRFQIAHIWILAPTQQELAKLMEIAEQLSFTKPSEF